jgi:hypothetical protein
MHTTRELIVGTDPNVSNFANRTLSSDVAAGGLLSESSMKVWCLAGGSSFYNERFQALVNHVRSWHRASRPLVNEPAWDAAHSSTHELTCAPSHLFATPHPSICSTLGLFPGKAWCEI